MCGFFGTNIIHIMNLSFSDIYNQMCWVCVYRGEIKPQIMFSKYNAYNSIIFLFFLLIRKYTKYCYSSIYLISWEVFVFL